MKNFFLALATLILTGLLGTAIYVYTHPKSIDKLTDNDKKANQEMNTEKDESNQNRESEKDSSINQTQQSGSNETNQKDAYGRPIMFTHDQVVEMAKNGETVKGMVDKDYSRWYESAEGTIHFIDQNGVDNIVVKGKSPTPSNQDEKGKDRVYEKESNKAKEDKVEKKNNFSNQEQVTQQAQQQEQKQMSVQKTQQNVQAQQNVTADNSPKPVIEKQPVDKE